MEEDDRFKEIVNDPRFRTLRRNERKVKIDKRFKAMFKEKRFNLKYSVDKRGRKLNFENIDHLKKVYEVSSDDEKKNDDEDNKSEESGLSEVLVKIDKSEKNNYTDLRGENNIDESSSSDEESSEEEVEEEVDHKWGELDKDALRGDSISSRLAVCNIDWDRIKASDLFILFSSFSREIGGIKSVKIYTSQFGKERIKEEEIKGPKELVEVTLKEKEQDPFAKGSDESDNEVINSENAFISEKLREYQIKRLKYYYAVVGCANQETALHLYQELDGLEYESSASTLDIRFIPDEITFDDEEPSSECNSMPSLLDYEPPEFVTTALQQSKVKLTWDETDPQRSVKLRKAYEASDKIKDDLRLYLASDDEEENETDDLIEQTNIDKNDSECHKILKYKELLKSLEQAKEKEKPEFELEVTWEPNLDELDNQLDEKEKEKNMTVFEKERMKKQKSKKMRKIKSKIFEEDKDDNKNELNLLTFDNEENKKHFNYDDFIENKSKKRKKKKKNQDFEQKDNFKFDPEDARFSAIYSSHLYNIEQSDPHFKKTKAVQELLDRKIKKSRTVD